MLGISIHKAQPSVCVIAGVPSVSVGGRRDHVDARGRSGGAGVTGLHLLRDHVPRLDAVLLAQGLPLRLQPLEVQHLRRTVLQRVRVQLPPPQQESPMTVCRGPFQQY